MVSTFVSVDDPLALEKALVHRRNLDARRVNATMQVRWVILKWRRHGANGGPAFLATLGDTERQSNKPIFKGARLKKG